MDEASFGPRVPSALAPPLEEEAQIEAATGLRVYAFPKEREFFVELRLSAQAALAASEQAQPPLHRASHVAH